MKILSIETSTAQGSIALCDNESLIEECSFKTNENFGQNIFGYIKTILSSNKLSLKNIDLITVNHGPGSYTGLRIGVTCANTLSWANSIPLVGVSALLSMVIDTDIPDEILTTIIYSNVQDAFIAQYALINQQWTSIKADQKIPWENLEEQIASSKSVYYYGNKPMPIDLGNSITINEFSPTAKSIGKAGFKSFNTDTAQVFGNVQPNYLKDFEATPKKKSQ